jgi:hypothetical protein
MLELRINWGIANAMEQPEEYTAIYSDAGRVTVLALTFMTGIRF